MVLPGLKSPATAGWWNPRILLPEVCEQIGPTPQVADVLCHELVHVARRDYLWAGLSDLICCLLFFHPAVWKARKAMVLQGELACDLAVLETRSGDRADYADSLTYFVRLRMLQDGFSLGVDFAASASLGLRIRTILDNTDTCGLVESVFAGGCRTVFDRGLWRSCALQWRYLWALPRHLLNTFRISRPMQTAAEHSPQLSTYPTPRRLQDAPKDSLNHIAHAALCFRNSRLHHDEQLKFLCGFSSDLSKNLLLGGKVSQLSNIRLFPALFVPLWAKSQPEERVAVATMTGMTTKSPFYEFLIFPRQI